MNKNIRIALVGCGALTKIFYQPVLHRFGIKPFALVDPFTERTKLLAKQWGAGIVVASVDELLGNIDAAIIASPNFLHAEQARLFLEKGIHVLLEKPMTVNGQEGVELIATAKNAGAILQVAMMRRFWKLNMAVKKILENNLLGKITSISMMEGGVFNWPAQSLALFDKKQSLGGVLIDTGAHTLDLLCWWMQDIPVSIIYKDDNKGGVETDAELSFKFKNSGAKAEVCLTRIRNLSNEYKITGEKGWIMVRPSGNLFETSGSSITKQIYNIYPEAELKNQTIHDVFDEQVKSWLQAISAGTQSPVSAESVLPSIQLIENCYSERIDKSYPWD